MANIQPSSQPKTICQICRKAYVKSGNCVIHIQKKHPSEASQMLRKQPPSEKRGVANINMEVDNMEVDNIEVDDMEVDNMDVI